MTRVRRTTLSALGVPYPHGTIMWSPGDPEEHLHGFATAAARAAYERGDPGPHERVLRDPASGPLPDEVLLARALCLGTVEATIAYIENRDGEHPCTQ